MCDQSANVEIHCEQKTIAGNFCALRHELRAIIFFDSRKFLQKKPYPGTKKDDECVSNRETRQNELISFEEMMMQRMRERMFHNTAPRY